ncbi:MAG: DUF2891 domain-containing protein [Streptosporangiaceae bacterium]|jgi:hypothetical protein
MDLAAEFGARLRAEAPAYAKVAMENIVREYPAYVTGTLTGPGELLTRPRDRSPVFYGSYDWHSAVEMHWLLVRLLKLAPDRVPVGQIRGLLDSQFTEAKLRVEAAFMGTPAGARLERPYGWGWALDLMNELATWTTDRDAVRWARAMTPLASVLAQNFLDWLASAPYPLRSGLHSNSSFGISRALPYAGTLASGGEPELAAAAASATLRWYYGDQDYPAHYEPSGSDFLSPALAEAELMARLLPAEEFPGWLSRFLPGVVDEIPGSLFTPAMVGDRADGQGAHLHGLNLSRAWCWRRLAEALPPDDPRVVACEDAALRHSDAGLPGAADGDYMVTHWVPAYAVLLLG